MRVPLAIVSREGPPERSAHPAEIAEPTRDGAVDHVRGRTERVEPPRGCEVVEGSGPVGSPDVSRSEL